MNIVYINIQSQFQTSQIHVQTDSTTLAPRVYAQHVPQIWYTNLELEFARALFLLESVQVTRHTFHENNYTNYVIFYYLCTIRFEQSSINHIMLDICRYYDKNHSKTWEGFGMMFRRSRNIMLLYRITFICHYFPPV